MVIFYLSLTQRPAKLLKSEVPKEKFQKHFKKTFDKAKVMW